MRDKWHDILAKVNPRIKYKTHPKIASRVCPDQCQDWKHTTSNHFHSRGYWRKSAHRDGSGSKSGGIKWTTARWLFGKGIAANCRDFNITGIPKCVRSYAVKISRIVVRVEAASIVSSDVLQSRWTGIWAICRKTPTTRIAGAWNSEAQQVQVVFESTCCAAIPWISRTRTATIIVASSFLPV